MSGGQQDGFPKPSADSGESANVPLTKRSLAELIFPSRRTEFTSPIANEAAAVRAARSADGTRKRATISKPMSRT